MDKARALVMGARAPQNIYIEDLVMKMQQYLLE